MQFVVIRQAAENVPPLEERGPVLAARHDELSALAETLRCRNSIPSLYLTSTAAQAQATANLLRDELGGEPVIQELEALTPNCPPPSLKNLASEAQSRGIAREKITDGGVVAIVGDEPRLQALVASITTVWWRPLEPAQALILEEANWSKHEAGMVKPDFRSPAPREPDKDTLALATQRYATICSSIKATDEISFKLLGFVPLVSGVGIFALVPAAKQPLSSGGVALFALFAALITFSLYRWELRNVGICEWFRDRVADIERDEFGLISGQYLSLPPAPRLSLFGWDVRIGKRRASGIGKQEAETLLYGATMAAWIALACYGAVRAFLLLR
jgi:phosphohistidine phosphatase SixA